MDPFGFIKQTVTNPSTICSAIFQKEREADRQRSTDREKESEREGEFNSDYSAIIAINWK